MNDVRPMSRDDGGDGANGDGGAVRRLVRNFEIVWAMYRNCPAL